MTIKIKMKKVLLATAVSGLAIQSSLVSADTGTKFDLEQNTRPEGQFPPLHMDEICIPLDVCSVPTVDFINDFDKDEFDAVGGKFSNSYTREDTNTGGKSPLNDDVENNRERLDRPQNFSPVGVIFAGDVADFDNDVRRPQMKFLISGIRNDIATDIFIIYNNREAEGAETQVMVSSLGGGNIGLPINLDPAAAVQNDKLQIIAGVTVQPQQTLAVMQSLPDSPLGTDRGDDLQTVVISIPLTNINQAVIDGRLPQDIYFQAIAVKHSDDGALDFTQAQFSDVDHFIVDIALDGGAQDTGSKAASFVTDTGEAEENTDSSGKVTGNSNSTPDNDTRTPEENNSNGGKF